MWGETPASRLCDTQSASHLVSRLPARVPTDLKPAVLASTPHRHSISADRRACARPRCLARRFGWLVDHLKADVLPEVRNRLLQLAAKGCKTWLGPNPEQTKVYKMQLATARGGVYSSTSHQRNEVAARASVDEDPSGRLANDALMAPDSALLR